MCPYKFYSNCHLTCTTVNHQLSNFSLPLHFSPLYFSSHIHVSYVYTVPPQIDPVRTLHSSSHPCIYSNITSTSVTLSSPGYGQGPLGPADIRSATRLPPQPPGPPGVPLGDMGVMMSIF